MIVGNFGSATETMTLVLPEDATAKDYSLAQVNVDPDAYAFYVNGSGETDQFDGVSGTIKVTAISATNIESTFNFVGKNDANASKTITEGKFKVKR